MAFSHTNLRRSVVMQSRCVHCLIEQYGPAIWDVSYGQAGCCWCGKWSEPLTPSEYLAKLRSRYQQNGTTPPAQGAK